jgi:hypothetical protein
MVSAGLKSGAKYDSSTYSPGRKTTAAGLGGKARGPQALTAVKAARTQKIQQDQRHMVISIPQLSS